MDKSSAVYRRAVAQANAEYGTKSSIYKSLGGIIEGRSSAKKGISRWFREQWV